MLHLYWPMKKNYNSVAFWKFAIAVSIMRMEFLNSLTENKKIKVPRMSYLSLVKFKPSNSKPIGSRCIRGQEFTHCDAKA